MFKRMLLACGLLAGFSAAAYASPMIGLDDPCGASATALSLTSNLLVTSGGGVNCFYNPFDFYITDVSFTAQLATGLDLPSFELDPNSPSDPIECENEHGNFFQSCSVAYDSSSGDLTIRFFGVNPPDSDDSDPYSTDPELGRSEEEGIPTLLYGCSSAAGTGEFGLSCDSKGNFLITLNDGYSDSGDSGQWNTLGLNGAAFDVSEINGMSVPEPSAAAALGIGLVLLGGFARRHARRRA